MRGVDVGDRRSWKIHRDLNRFVIFQATAFTIPCSLAALPNRV